MVIDKLIRTKRRSISLKISSTGELIVRAPVNCSYQKINEVVEQKEKWIKLHQSRILENKMLNSDIISLKKVLFLGYTKNVVFVENLKNLAVTTECFFISTKYKDNLNKQKKLISNYLIEQASTILTKRVDYFATLMQLSPSSLSLTNSKRLWGSCGQNDDIKLNWRLVMTSPDIIDYVVVHELAHIVEFNHSANFWKIVQSLIPDYKEKRNLLKKGDFLLNLFR